MASLSVEIIEEVKSRPELWCSNNPIYQCRSERDIVARTAAKTLGLKPEIFKKKWKNLKDNYRKEWKKEMACVSSGETWKSSWPYYESMAFLKHELVNGGDSSSFSVKPELNNYESADYDDLTTPTDHLLLNKHWSLADNGYEIPLNPDGDEMSETTRKRSGGDPPDEPEAKRFAAVSGDIRETQWIDEDYHFCMSILPMMKSLTTVQKLEFRGEVNKWLLELITKNETESSNHE